MNAAEVIERWNGDGSALIPDRDPKYEHELQAELLARVPHDATGQMIDLFQPAPSEDKPHEMLCIWECRAKREINRRLRQRPGRAFQRMFPWLSQPELGALVDWYRERYLAESFGDLVLKIGKAPEDFRHAYVHDQAPYTNPDTSSFRKSLANSCMRHDFEELPHHPAEAYASGDFQIVWAEDRDGLIHGRCVMRIDPPRHGPVYGVSETAMDALEAKLAELGSEPASYDCWVGARVARVEDGGRLIGPYLDVGPQLVDSATMAISTRGDLTASNTEGYFGESDRECCDACGENYDEDDGCFVHGTFYCESCYRERFICCDRCDEHDHRDEAETVHIRSWGGAINHESWCASCVESSAQQTEDGDYWHEDDTRCTHDDRVISVQAYERDYGTCELSDEIYHADELTVLADGRTAAVPVLRDDPETYRLNEAGVWEEIRDAA